LKDREEDILAGKGEGSENNSSRFVQEGPASPKNK